MSSTTISPILLLLGAGPRIGQSVATAFATKGYKIALVARSLDEEDSTPDLLNIKADLSDPTSIPSIFSKVKEVLGLPTVIVYNGSFRTLKNPQKPLDMSLSDLQRDFAVNTFSVLEAAKEAVAVFEQLPPTASRTSICTGNILNEVSIMPAVVNGMTKSATAHLIDAASRAYRENGFRFYWADERKADGGAANMDISGEAAAEFYWELAEGKTEVPWRATHVKGTGYFHFDRRSEF